MPRVRGRPQVQSAVELLGLAAGPGAAPAPPAPPDTPAKTGTDDAPDGPAASQPSPPSAGHSEPVPADEVAPDPIRDGVARAAADRPDASVKDTTAASTVDPKQEAAPTAIRPSPAPQPTAREGRPVDAPPAGAGKQPGDEPTAQSQKGRWFRRRAPEVAGAPVPPTSGSSSNQTDTPEPEDVHPAAADAALIATAEGIVVPTTVSSVERATVESQAGPAPEVAVPSGSPPEHAPEPTPTAAPSTGGSSPAPMAAAAPPDSVQDEAAAPAETPKAPWFRRNKPGAAVAPPSSGPGGQAAADDLPAASGPTEGPTEDSTEGPADDRVTMGVGGTAYAPILNDPVRDTPTFDTLEADSELTDTPVIDSRDTRAGWADRGGARP